MSKLRSSSLRSILCQSAAGALILCLPVMVGACSPKDKGPSAEKSTRAANLDLKSPTRKAFAKHFEVPNRKVSEEEAQKALKGLSLLDSSEDSLSWKKSTGKAGTYSYTGLAAKTDDGTLSIDKAQLFGVHMDGDTATFDRADFSGITVFNESDDVTVSFGKMSLAHPTPAMAKSIITSLSSIDGVDDLDLESKGDEMGFGALSIGNMTVKSAELNGRVHEAIWGKNSETDRSDFLLDDVKFKFENPQGESGNFSLENFTALGLRADLINQLKNPTNMATKMGQNFDEVKLDNMTFESSAVHVNTTGFSGKATETKGITTIKQVSEPFTIKLKDAPKNPQAAQAYAMVKELGFDKLVFESSQTQIIDSNKDTMSVENGLISMKDGFNLSYNYNASGMNALLSQLKTGNKSKDIDAVMEAIKINGIQLRLEDKSIVERGLGLAAKFRGASPDQLKKEMKVAISLAPLAAGSDIERDLIKELGGAVSEFVDGNGKSLSIILEPDTPIAMTEMTKLRSGNTSLDDLGFSAKAE